MVTHGLQDLVEVPRQRRLQVRWGRGNERDGTGQETSRFSRRCEGGVGAATAQASDLLGGEREGRVREGEGG